MTSEITTAEDGPEEVPLPLWQAASARVRRLQRTQLIMLLIAGAAIVVIVAGGGIAGLRTVQAQTAAEERGDEIRSLRADFTRDLFIVQGGLNRNDQGATAETLLRFSGLALRVIALASSYEPDTLEERIARDAVLDIYAQFTNLQNATDPDALDATLNGEIGSQLATDALGRFDAWANANARSLSMSRNAQDILIGRIAIAVVALVLLMSASFVLIWRRIESARREALTEAYAQTRRFDSLVRNASDIVMVVDNHGAITYCSESASRLLGWSYRELGAMSLSDVVHPEDRAELARLVDAAADDGPAERITWRFMHREGDWLDVETLATNLLSDPAVGGFVLNSRDVTDRKAAERKLEHLALHDPLTGLANRVLFEDRLSQALQVRARAGDDLAVLVLDLDDFKTVNDGLGHHAGDQLLTVVGERIGACLRPGDTAARLGGDEYGVLLTSIAGPAAARAVAQRIYNAVRAPAEIGGEEISIIASVGIALAPRHGDDPQMLLRYADLAMYAAKDLSGERIASFSGDMERALEERIRLRTDLAAAINEGNQLVLEYQPIIDLATGRLSGLEALLRWDHPVLGRVMPDRFIPLAEETGLIVSIGEHVMRTACAQAAIWNEASDGALSISVNLSARQLEDPRLIPVISQALDESGLPAELLTLEVTESILMQNLGDAITALESAKTLGVSVAIDDFGTGYSSLSQLGRLPVDVVKIDKSFVDRLSDGTADSDLAGVIVQLGAVLQLRTVAEGVEDADQLSELRRLGCDLGQGWLFARPMPAPEVIDLVGDADRSFAVADPAAR